MSKRLNELAEIVLDRVYTYGYQQRAEVDAQCRAEDDLLAAQRKLADVTADRDKLQAEIETLRQELDAGEKALRILATDRDHWRESRRQAIEAGELMQAEIETLRAQLADAKREASEEFAERQVLQAESSADSGELERLREFRRKVRKARGWWWGLHDIYDPRQFAIDCNRALDDLDANPTPITKPMGGAE